MPTGVSVPASPSGSKLTAARMASSMMCAASGPAAYCGKWTFVVGKNQRQAVRLKRGRIL